MMTPPLTKSVRRSRAALEVQTHWVIDRRDQSV
jgi:hypothetical protein